MHFRNVIAHFGGVNDELVNKDPDVVLEQEPLIILDTKSAFLCPIMLKTQNTPDIFPENCTL